MKRRELFTTVPALAAALSARVSFGGTMTESDTLTELSAVAAVTAMKNGELSAETYARALRAAVNSSGTSA